MSSPSSSEQKTTPESNAVESSTGTFTINGPDGKPIRPEPVKQGKVLKFYKVLIPSETALTD